MRTTLRHKVMKKATTNCHFKEDDMYNVFGIFNRMHPEKRSNEKWLMNIFNDDVFNQIEYRSKRKGKTAYDIYGNALDSDSFPVFVDLAEWNEKVK